MKPTIYELTYAFEQIADEFEAVEGTTDEAVITALYARIDALELALDQKVDNVLAVTVDLEARAVTRRKEAARLIERAKIDERAAERLEDVTIKLLDAAGRKTIETARFKCTVRGNGGKVPVVREPCSKVEDLPTDLVKTTITTAPDTDRIRACLEAGEDIPGFHLGAVGRHLRRS